MKQMIAGAVMVPHPPLIVPEVGRGQESLIQDTIRAYRKAADLVAEWRPETIVVMSPHALMYADYFHISPGKEAAGDFGAFLAPEITVRAEYDEELVGEICRIADSYDFPMGTLGEKSPELDHGTMIPLYFINQAFGNTCPSGGPRSAQSVYKLVRVGGSGLSFEEHYRAGQIIAEAARKTGRRIVLVGSGDLSHKLKNEGPYGYSPKGPEYDKRMMDVMGNGAFGELLEFQEDFCAQAGECGHRSFTTMAGILDGLAVDSRSLSYEGPFGVGYGICVYEVAGRDESRYFLQTYQKKERERCKKLQEREDSYVALARKSLEHYVRAGRLLDLGSEADAIPPELLERQAGVFVSLKKHGVLRGCIGTTSPVCGNVAEEITANAVSAGIHDPRFPAVREFELDTLVYSVDVLGKPEPVNGPESLDVKRYGVIVSKGQKRGLLLPDLEEVDTVEQQIAIAKQKAGIPTGDMDVRLERFEVVRHGGVKNG